MRTLRPTLSRTIAVVLCLGGVTLSGAAAPKEEKARSYQVLSASLSVGEKGSKAGEPMEVTVTFTASADTHRLFNPFFSGLLERPGRLVIRDAGGEVVNTLLGPHEGSRRTPTEGDHVRLPAGGFVGVKLEVYPLRKAGGGEDLPPGKYTMQMVLYGSLLGLGGKEDAKEIVTTQRVAFRISK
jgi:hypothetical protein